MQHFINWPHTDIPPRDQTHAFTLMRHLTQNRQRWKQCNWYHVRNKLHVTPFQHMQHTVHHLMTLTRKVNLSWISNNLRSSSVHAWNHTPASIPHRHHHPEASTIFFSYSMQNATNHTCPILSSLHSFFKIAEFNISTK